MTIINIEIRTKNIKDLPELADIVGLPGSGYSLGTFNRFAIN